MNLEFDIHRPYGGRTKFFHCLVSDAQRKADVGFVAYGSKPNNVTGSEMAHISLLNISPGYRGNGASEEIMRRVEYELVSRGFYAVDALVSDMNIRAMKFFQRLGWKEDGGSNFETHVRFQKCLVL